MNTLNKIKKDDLLEFTDICSSLFTIDKDKFLNDAINSIRYYQGDTKLREKLRYLQILEERWYDSLKNGNPDYSVYNDTDILPDIWSCWKVYSREYIKSIFSEKSLGHRDSHGNWSNLKSIVNDMKVNKVNSILDSGCGIGYTTSALKEIFIEANVYGLNLKDTAQYKLCEYMSQKNNFNLISNLDQIGKDVDLVFASEYFEHFENPISHLDEILRLNPKYFIIANSFSSKSIGHFDTYFKDSEKIIGKNYGRVFNSYLRSKGYHKVNTSCYNDRPSYWKRKDLL